MFKIREKFILWRVQQGKIDAFEEIYDHYAPKIYKFIYFKISSKEDAEDLASQTFTKLLKYLKREIKINHLQALLYNIARNLIVDFYRQRKITVAFDDKIKDELTNNDDLNLNINLSIEINSVKKAIKLLNNNEQEIIILRFINDLPIKEIAKILGKSQGNIKVSLHRALKKLKEILTISNK